MAAESSDDVVLVVSTIPVSTVDPVVRVLLDERLVACANVLPPARSLYRWEGRVEESEEQLVLFKTTRRRCLELRARLSELHPYDVPEILEWDAAGGLPAYLDWVAESCRPEG